MSDIVHLLWEQGNHEREISSRTTQSGYHPQLVGVFAHEETPRRLASEYNDTHRYSTRWVSSSPMETLLS